MGSIAFLNDQAMYEQGRLIRNTERGKQAAEDANLSAGGVANAFSAAFGSPITEKEAPQLHKLLTNMIEDAGDLATRGAKQKYMRIRPFAFYGVATCNTKEQDTLAKNGSYPSGHTSIGWATALVLAEINPQRQDQILKRGYDLGQSRVICGYHWQSDGCCAYCRLSGRGDTAHQPGLPAAVAKSERRICRSAQISFQNGPAAQR